MSLPDLPDSSCCITSAWSLLFDGLLNISLKQFTPKSLTLTLVDSFIIIFYQTCCNHNLQSAQTQHLLKMLGVFCLHSPTLV